MNTVIFPAPDMPTLKHFILNSNWIDACNIMAPDIDDTLNKVCIQPFAAGHIMAIDGVLKKLAPSRAWPVKHATDFASEAKSHATLQWLRDLHKTLMLPVARFNEMLPEDQYINAKDAGEYRLSHKANADGRTAANRWLPKPTGIPRLLHWWNARLGKFHLDNLKRLDRPGSLTVEDMNEFADEAERLHLQHACIGPFVSGNGRVGRLVENALRLRWGLAWKTYLKSDRLNYVRKIAAYENSDEWQKLLVELKAHPKLS